MRARPSLRPPTPAEAEQIQDIWEDSHQADDPGGRARGGWSIDSWATDQCALVLEDHVVGVAAVSAGEGSGTVVGRVALDLEHRQSALADVLIQGSVDLARKAHGDAIRLFLPEGADWALTAARAVGFEQVRSIYHMQLAGEAPLPELEDVDGVRIRPMRPGEEPAILEALNRFWEGTWEFVPIRAEMLEADLDAQREGMLVGVEVERDAHIVATCHAVFDPADQNPNGDPRAWISNVTVDPAYRGRGLGRAMLVSGLRFLRSRGARSITLGVDAGNSAPVQLYLSAGFQTISSTTAWDLSLRT